MATAEARGWTIIDGDHVSVVKNQLQLMTMRMVTRRLQAKAPAAEELASILHTSNDEQPSSLASCFAMIDY